MNDPNVSIRMYRVGLGDCHVIRFESGGQRSHILIDCGYLPASGFPEAAIDDIVGDIVDYTGGHIDALVVTHEHQDHLQGFVDGEEKFKSMDKGELWLAWTEKPGQKILTTKRSLAACEAAVRTLSASTVEEERSMADALQGMLGFSQGTAEAFALVKSWYPVRSRKYLNPGDAFEPDWLPGVRVYVLGPPKALEMLHKTKGKEDTEMYRALAQSCGFAAAALNEEEPGTLSPFDGKYAREKLCDTLAKSYESEPWRGIQNDWLLSATRMALQADSYTNNTSLVLAFELKHSGKVLLFVGDAQIGNWESWKSLEFENGSGGKVKAADLLARTTYYKVGHHGSHNATLVENGLLSMTAADFHAAIPTNEHWAQRVRHWSMPNHNLYAALKERSTDPVLRTDQPAENSLCVMFSL
jgi:beta-lactamase superfamily II metal-dependent hydrolase